MNILLVSSSSTMCPRHIHPELTAYLPNKTPFSDRCNAFDWKADIWLPWAPGSSNFFLRDCVNDAEFVLLLSTSISQLQWRKTEAVAWVTLQAAPMVGDWNGMSNWRLPFHSSGSYQFAVGNMRMFRNYVFNRENITNK